MRQPQWGSLLRIAIVAVAVSAVVALVIWNSKQPTHSGGYPAIPRDAGGSVGGSATAPYSSPMAPPFNQLSQPYPSP
jgi:hypothetical protein